MVQYCNVPFSFSFTSINKSQLNSIVIIAAEGNCFQLKLNKSMPRKALLGSLTILINLYQNCFAPFGHVRRTLQRSHWGRRPLRPKAIAPKELGPKAIAPKELGPKAI